MGRLLAAAAAAVCSVGFVVGPAPSPRPRRGEERGGAFLESVGVERSEVSTMSECCCSYPLSLCTQMSWSIGKKKRDDDTGHGHGHGCVCVCASLSPGVHGWVAPWIHSFDSFVSLSCCPLEREAERSRVLCEWVVAAAQHTTSVAVVGRRMI